VVTPVLSVIIPTRNRITELLRTVEAVASQARPEAPLEIVVVDDGSEIPVPEPDLADGQWPWASVRLVRQSPSGPARARNRGVVAARADRVLLLGDDTRPVAGGLAAHLEGDRRHEVGVQGMVDWDPEIGVTRVMRFMAPAGPQFWFAGLADGDELPWGSLSASNLSAPRRWLLEEPFDEGFTDACLEDTELAWRWRRRGWKVLFDQHAVCLHRHRYGAIDELLSRQRRVGRWSRRAIRQHPALVLPLVVHPAAASVWLALRAVGRVLLLRGRQEDYWDVRWRWAQLSGLVTGRRT
jgi:glycosyltransferase involved in cell wall biosynthesis